MTLISSTLKLECDPLTAWLFLMSSLEEFVDTKLNLITLGMENAKLCKLTLIMAAETPHEQSISTI